MPQFALYHYELSAFRNKEPLLFPVNDPARNYKTVENLFESYLPARGGSLNVLEPKEIGSGENARTEYEPHESEVLQNLKHIIAFRIQRNGKKKIETKDWQHIDEPNHPSVRVLIDNREDRCLIAIENRSSFKAEKAFELIKDHFKLQLKNHNVRFECYPLIKKADFWDSVKEIKNRFGDFIKRVQFNFVGESNIISNTFAGRLSSFLDVINSSHGGIFMDFKNEDHLDRAKNDITQMADLCYRNSLYNLSVKFRDFGTFSYGQDIKAQWGLEDDKIETFSQKHVQTDVFIPGNPAYKAIAEWFDKIKELFADYIENGMKELHNFGNYIIKKNKTKEINGLLHSYIDIEDKPQKLLKPLAAAVAAGCIAKPALEDFNFEFQKKISSSSYNRYVKDNTNNICAYDGDSAYYSMLK